MEDKHVRLKENDVHVLRGDKLLVDAPDSTVRENLLFTLEQLLQTLPKVGAGPRPFQTLPPTYHNLPLYSGAAAADDV